LLAAWEELLKGNTAMRSNLLSPAIYQVTKPSSLLRAASTMIALKANVGNLNFEHFS